VYKFIKNLFNRKHVASAEKTSVARVIPSDIYYGYVVLNDGCGNKFYIDKNCQSLPGGPSLHLELRYEKRKTGWRVRVDDSLKNVGLARQELRAMKTRQRTWQHTLKSAMLADERIKLRR
tara:strand:+ start:1864 stop:2223 length:360 start_codon:yes stop_codon:yes gene_type:complete